MQLVDLGKDLIDRHLLPAIKAELAVAPGAAQVAAREANKNTRQSSVGGFALQRFVDFSDQHGKQLPVASRQLPVNPGLETRL
jgi:hypothetical protein